MQITLAADVRVPFQFAWSTDKFIILKVKLSLSFIIVTSKVASEYRLWNVSSLDASCLLSSTNFYTLGARLFNIVGCGAFCLTSIILFTKSGE